MIDRGRFLTVPELEQRRENLAEDVMDLQKMRGALADLKYVTARRRIWFATVIDNEIAKAEQKIAYYGDSITEKQEMERAQSSERRAQKAEENTNILILGGVRYKLEPLP